MGEMPDEEDVVSAAGDSDLGTEDDEDDDFDFGAVADAAIKAASGGSAVRPGGYAELALDCGVGPEHLYITDGGRDGAFDTSSAPGVSRLDIRDFCVGPADAPPPSAAPRPREVRGAPLRPADDAKLRKKEAKLAREESLDGWFGLKKRRTTPEEEKELLALKMRGTIDPKRFYKANDSKALPKYFTFATEIGGGMDAAGEKQAGQREIHAHSGQSFLDSALRDSKTQDWTWKKYGEVGSRGEASVNSGHGKQRQKASKGKDRTRGGAWKKKRKS